MNKEHSTKKTTAKPPKKTTRANPAPKKRAAITALRSAQKPKQAIEALVNLTTSDIRVSPSTAKQSLKPETSLRIGELLVREKLIDEQGLKKALKIQEKERAEASQPMGSLMLKKKLITEGQLQTLLEHPDLRKNIGTLLVDKGLVSQKVVDKCLNLKKADEHLGQVLIKHGLIQKETLNTALMEQSEGLKIGELAFRLNMISEEDLDSVLAFKSGQRSLGEVLCDLKLTSPKDLNKVLKKYSKQLKLGEILLKQNAITEKEFSKALQEQKRTKEMLGAILRANKIISADQLYAALSRQYNIPFKSMAGFAFDEKNKQTLTSIIGKKYSQKHGVLPLSLEGDRLTLAIKNPEATGGLQELQTLNPHLKIFATLITDEKLDALAHELYAYSPKDTDEAEKKSKGATDLDVVEIDLQKERKATKHAVFHGGPDMMAQQMVDYIIKYGLINGASDIHIEQDRKGARLRYRKDGVCHGIDKDWIVDKINEMPGAIISRIKVMSNLDIAEKRLPQDGVFRISYLDKASDTPFDLDFRVATCPAIVGENLTIRILDSRNAQLGLENLDHSRHILMPLKRMFKSSAGMILVSGPTGSGKSSTLYAALRYIYNPGIKIITAEDPIEYSFPGIMQTQVRPKIGLTFARLLRSFLRLDPDVILVGEIRDEETARIGFDAAQTGHLLLSTLHTNDAISAVTRLRDLNVEHNQIAASLMGVLAQRLVRKICDKCIKPYIPSKDEWSIFFNQYPEHLRFFKGVGCKNCSFTGYRGRLPISELIEVNREIAMALSQGAGENALRRIAREGGMLTMIDDGMMKLDQTTLSEIIRVTPFEMVKEFRSRSTGTFKDENGTNEDTAIISTDTSDNQIEIVIADPDAQRDAIEQFYLDYCSINDKMGLNPNNGNAALFRQFIARQHHILTEKYSCEEVAFNIEHDPKNISISASPIKDIQ